MLLSDMLKRSNEWKLKWSDDLLTGEEKVDYYHKTIIENGNKLFELFSKGCNDNEKIEKLIDETIDLIIEHFDYEEKIFHENNLDGFEEHVIKHKEMRDIIDSLNLASSKLIQALFLNQIIVFYLADHLEKDDKKMIKQLKEMN